MKMKLNALSLAIAAAAGLAATAAQANDVAMFPYVVSSPTVTTIVSIVDRGVDTTQRYTANGTPSTSGNHLHWRLNYKAGANATNNTAVCSEVNRWLPTSPNDIQTVDLGGRFGANSAGVLFNDPSVNNNWEANTTGGNTYMLAKDAGSPVRGVLYVHNADNTTGQTIYGEAMILEFGSGAAWGYQSINMNNAFDLPTNEANAGGPVAPLTIMPPAQVTTRLFVTPVVSTGTGLLGTHGASVAGWDVQTTRVDLAMGSPGTSTMYNRDERSFSGGPAVDVTCVGAVDVTELMGANAASTMANGGWSQVRLQSPTIAGRVGTNRAFITKLEFSTGQSFNGEGSFGTFNNGFIMR